MPELSPPAPDDADDLQVELSPAEDDIALWVPQSASDGPEAVFGRDPSPPLVTISLDALQDMIGHGSVETSREVGGVLLGRYGESPLGRITLLEDIVIANTAQASLTHVTFTHASWAEIHRQIDGRGDGALIVGWYHTHPGFGPFLSAHDLFIQSNFFGHPGHVALVLDPVQHLFAVFGWENGEIVKSAGCRVLARADQAEELSQLQKTLSYAVDSPESPLRNLTRRFGQPRRA